MRIKKESLQYKLIWILLLMLTTVFYYFYHYQVSYSSDSVTMIPLAMDWMKGNVFLKDWIVGTNNFFFTETIFYMPGLAMGIAVEQLMYFIPALTFSSFLVLTVYTFVIRKEDKEVSVRALEISAAYLLTVGVIAVQPAYTLLNANSHNGLYVFLVLELLLLFQYVDTGEKRCIIAYLLVGILMIYSDGVALMVFVAPVCAYVCYELLCNFIRKRREKNLHLVIAGGATVAAYLGSKGITTLLEMVGGLETLGLPMKIVNIQEAWKRLLGYKSQVTTLWGVRENFDGIVWIDIYNNMIRALIVFTAVAFFIQIFFIVTGKITRERMILWLIVLFNVGGSLFTDTVIYHRYIVPTYLFGMLLMFFTLYDAVRLLQRIFPSVVYHVLRGIILAGCAYLAVMQISEIPGANPDMSGREALARYIETNQLGNGYGDFWTASVVASYTQYDNNIYPVYSEEEGLAPYTELIKNEWYQEKNIHYVVLCEDDNGNLMCKSEQLVTLFGEADDIYTSDGYMLMYWNQDLSNKIQMNETK